MRPVSDTFLRAVTGSHRMRSRARIVTAYQDGPDPDGEEVGIIDGSVGYNSDRPVRGRANPTIEGFRWDFSPGGLITPYGNEIYLERGVTLDGIGTEWVGLGYFRMYGVTQDDAGDGPLGVEGRDRISGLVDARLEQPVQYLSSNTVSFVFDDLILAVYPSATIMFDDSTGAEALGRNTEAERDRYEFLNDLAESYGKVFYVDHEGVFRIEDPPDPSNPVFEIHHGKDGILIEMAQELNRDGVYNAMVVEGESTDEKPPILGVARDNNPLSPTYYYGNFGQVPKFFTSDFVKTEAQARRAAASMLKRNLGLPHEADLTSVPNPALETLDPISVSYGDGPTDVIETFTIQQIDIPLVASAPMSAIMKEQTNLIVEEG